LPILVKRVRYLD